MAAREQLVARRETHLDQLADKLQEDRVRRVVEPLLSGGDERPFSARDVEYVRDLGLIARDPAAPHRQSGVRRGRAARADAGGGGRAGAGGGVVRAMAGGGLDVAKLLGAFQAFFREHSEHWVGALRLPRGRAAAPPAGVPAPHRE